MRTSQGPSLRALPLAIALRRDALQRLFHVAHEPRVREAAVAEVAHGAHRLLQRVREGLLFLVEAPYLRLEVLDRAVKLGDNGREGVFRVWELAVGSEELVELAHALGA